MDYQLVLIRGKSASQVLKLGSGVTVVGRGQDCQLRIRASAVSRKHCQLFEKQGLLLVKDLGSSNGTFVNGKRIDDQRVLEPGDILSFGKVRFRVEKVGVPVAAKEAGGKPADTAVAEQALGIEDEGDSEEFEIDFDEEPEQPSAQPAEAEPTAAPPGTAEVEPKNEAEEKTTELGDDAVADFLLNIDLDDEDKR